MEQTKIKYQNKKYRILEILNTKYSKDEATALKKQIIRKLHISKRTFSNYIYLDKTKSLEISYINLIKIANILKVDIDDLINFKIK